MTDAGGVVRTTHELTADDQRALVSQCTRCLVRDMAWWAVPAAVAGVGTGVALDRGAVLSALLVVVLVVVQVVQLRRQLRALHPVGSVVETVVGPHRLTQVQGAIALPQVTGVRREGAMVRIDLGRDHSHLLPEHADVHLLRSRAGVPAPTPEGPGVVVVPPGLGRRAAARIVARRLWRDVDSWTAGLAVVAMALLGAWAVAATVLVAHVGGLLVQASASRREFDRAFPPGIPVEAEWRGTELLVRSEQGEATVPVGPVVALRGRGDLVVAHRPGGGVLPLPSVVVTDASRSALLAN
ncbi:hypothetical protein [Nocardioides okcheonensis]|uniref:hypothetical protein n=1 Tax=Nocardioides okcheonensis TaxID=2894081 RepID=UPI001E2F5DEC|nr:hypothetical protein [Nocardioides okcheonensis]UFN43564.1 hypothetical protein LN652_16150 [Nocardioides okcheonensis]